MSEIVCAVRQSLSIVHALAGVALGLLLAGIEACESIAKAVVAALDDTDTDVGPLKAIVEFVVATNDGFAVFVIELYLRGAD